MFRPHRIAPHVLQSPDVVPIQYTQKRKQTKEEDTSDARQKFCCESTGITFVPDGGEDFRDGIRSPVYPRSGFQEIFARELPNEAFEFERKKTHKGIGSAGAAPLGQSVNMYRLSRKTGKNCLFE